MPELEEWADPIDLADRDFPAVAVEPEVMAVATRRTQSGDLSITTSVPDYRRGPVLGVPMAATTMVQMIETVEAWVDAGEYRCATGVNAHVVNQAWRDPKVLALLAANDLNYPDGQAVVWASNLLGLPTSERVATTDMIWPLAQMCARRGFGMFFLGAQKDVVELAAERLMQLYPGLTIDTHHGYVGPDDDDAVVAAINQSGARVLMVGMGDPQQQQWVHAHLGTVTPNVMLTCGGLFDWVSGSNVRPPQWVVRFGFEWLWRIYLEPRRLARRYLIGNPEFIVRLALAITRRLAGLRS